MVQHGVDVCVPWYDDVRSNRSCYASFGDGPVDTVCYERMAACADSGR